VSAPLEDTAGHAKWVVSALLGPGRIAESGATQAGPNEDSRSPARAPETDDPGTRTGRQLDAFGLNEPPADEVGQLNLLSAENHRRGSRDSGHSNDAESVIPVRIWRQVDPIQSELAELPLSLEWLSKPDAGEIPESVMPTDASTAIRLRSATELSLAARDPETWRLRYQHGVMPVDSFDAAPAGGGGATGPAEQGTLPGRLRGSIIHEVLERIDEDLDDLLEEVIEGIGEEGAGFPRGAGRTRVRERLLSEIEKLLDSEAWQEWVSSEHYREMPFVHFAGPDDWRQGRIDLFVPPRSDKAGEATAPLIVDFKTDRIAEEGTDRLVNRYRTQARVYREAVDAILDRDVGSDEGLGGRTRVMLYFTETGEKALL
jgi:hypothetical protein